MTEPFDSDGPFRRALGDEGFGFHFAVIREVHQLIAEESLPWTFLQTEVPVSNKGKETRIDFVLKSLKRKCYMVAECKRVNPAYGSWCFAGSCYYAERRAGPAVLLEQISMNGGEMTSRTRPLEGHVPYPVAVHVKQQGTKGDSHGDAKGIEESVTQVLRCASGLVNLLRNHYLTPEAPQPPLSVPVLIVPVIFTTAKLFVTDSDLALTDLETGRLPDASFERRSFVWHQHHASESIRSELPPLRTMAELAAVPISPFKPEVFARSVAIVSVAGMREFFNDLDSKIPGTFHRLI